MRWLLALLAILVGLLLTSIAFLLAASASDACHCSRPIAVAFPFATIVWGTTRFESLGGILMSFQFSAYAVLVALARSRRTRARIALMILGVHIVALVIALFVYKT
jgi:hypothetical protein